MRITFNRFDSWFIKGFDGLRNLLMDRAASNTYADQKLKIAIMRLLKAIKSVEAIEHEMPQDVSDEVLAEVTTTLAQFLECRVLQGRLYDQSRKDVLNLYHPIKTVLERLENESA